MKSDKQKSSAGKIQPLVINGLHGRVLRLPANNNKYAGKDILMLYGLHSSIERMMGIVENVADYGNVTMPDLPGFGGMDRFRVKSLSKILKMPLTAIQKKKAKEILLFKVNVLAGGALKRGKLFAYLKLNLFKFCKLFF
jgi:hypothetical protein